MNIRWNFLSLSLSVSSILLLASLITERDWRRSAILAAIATPATYALCLTATRINTHNFPAAGVKASHQPPQIAIFWDYENIRIPNRNGLRISADPLLDFVQQRGIIASTKVYSANWQKENKLVKDELQTVGFEFKSPTIEKANSADLQLSVDCLHYACKNPDIQSFVIVSSDLDFLYLRNALTDLGKTAIIIGRGRSTNRQLSSKDFFYDINDIYDTFVARQAPPESEDIASDSIPQDTSSREPTEREIIEVPYDRATEHLLHVLAEAEANGKSRSFPSIADLLRKSLELPGSGAIRFRTDTGDLHNFRAFLGDRQRNRLVTLAKVDNRSIISLPTSISAQEWAVILDALKTGFEQDPEIHSFIRLTTHVARAKREGLLNLNQQTIHDAVNLLIQENIIQKDGDQYFLRDDLLAAELSTDGQSNNQADVTRHLEQRSLVKS